MKNLILALAIALSAVASTANAAGRITLTWSDNSDNEEGFEVERRLAIEDAQWSVIATPPKDAERYVDTTAELMTPYVYRVWAYNGAGRSENPTNAETGTATVDIPSDAPADPNGLDVDEKPPYRPTVIQLGLINSINTTGQ